MQLPDVILTLPARIARGVALGLVLAVASAAQQAPPPPPPDAAPPSAPLSADQLQELVAPIALYPDSLVAQILAAATYPTQIVEAERFLARHPRLKGKKLAKKVNKQDWAPSVKGLTAFPSVLADMNENLSWTSELGDANYNQPQDVMNAIQFMRRHAQQAGNLQNTAQQTVNDYNGDIQIQPANPEVVYVPVYDPEYVYGYPVGMWPDFDPWWSDDEPYMSFGIGIGIEPFDGFGWGCRDWGLGWGEEPGVWYGGERWYSRSPDFYDRQAFLRGNYRGFGGRQGFVRARPGGFGGNRFMHGNFRRANGRRFMGAGARSGFIGGNGGRFNAGVRRGFAGQNRVMRGFASRPMPNVRTSAFGGFGPGGNVRGFAMRGMSSMHGGFGGGGFRGGFGGGFHGGGFGGGFRGGGMRR